MNALEKALYSKLTSDADLVNKLGGTRVYNQIIPQEASLPAVVFSLAGGGYENVAPKDAQNVLYLVKAVSKSSLKEAGEIDELVSDCLHRQSLDVEGWGVFWLRREAAVRYVEVGPGGETYYHAGANYRIRMEKE